MLGVQQHDAQISIDNLKVLGCVEVSPSISQFYVTIYASDQSADAWIGPQSTRRPRGRTLPGQTSV
jgi:hypothetical protein